MSVEVIASKNARNTFIIPVTWNVFDRVFVTANSLQEAFEYVECNIDEIPLGNNPEYAGDYQVIGNEYEDIIHDQTEKNICLEFDCDIQKATDAEGVKVKDSDIATAKYRWNGKNICIAVDIEKSFANDSERKLTFSFFNEYEDVPFQEMKIICNVNHLSPEFLTWKMESALEFLLS